MNYYFPQRFKDLRKSSNLSVITLDPPMAFGYNLIGPVKLPEKQEIYEGIEGPTPPLEREIFVQYLCEADEFESYEELKEQQADKPFYVPDKEELLKYADDLYGLERISATREYQKLRDFMEGTLKVRNSGRTQYTNNEPVRWTITLFQYAPQLLAHRLAGLSDDGVGAGISGGQGRAATYAFPVSARNLWERSQFRICIRPGGPKERAGTHATADMHEIYISSKTKTSVAQSTVHAKAEHIFGVVKGLMKFRKSQY